MDKTSIIRNCPHALIANVTSLYFVMRCYPVFGFLEKRFSYFPRKRKFSGIPAEWWRYKIRKPVFRNNQRLGFPTDQLIHDHLLPLWSASSLHFHSLIISNCKLLHLSSILQIAPLFKHSKCIHLKKLKPKLYIYIKSLLLHDSWR